MDASKSSAIYEIQQGAARCNKNVHDCNKEALVDLIDSVKRPVASSEYEVVSRGQPPDKRSNLRELRIPCLASAVSQGGVVKVLKSARRHIMWCHVYLIKHVDFVRVFVDRRWLSSSSLPALHFREIYSVLLCRERARVIPPPKHLR